MRYFLSITYEDNYYHTTHHTTISGVNYYDALDFFCYTHPLAIILDIYDPQRDPFPDEE